MRASLLLVAAAFAVGSAASAQDAPAASSGQLTYSAAKKAHYLATSDKRGADIYVVDAGPNDSVAAVEVVYDDRIIKVPGSTVSAGDKPSRLKTSLTAKDVANLP